MEEGFQLRDAFNKGTVKTISKGIKKVYPEFPYKKFETQMASKLEELSFLDRAKLIAQGLKEYFPQNFPRAAAILIKSLGPEPGPEVEELQGFEGFYIMPLCLYISQNGLEYPKESLKALYEMTKRFTAEGDIRPFLIRHKKTTLEFLEKLTGDKSPFARRLASEGTRPRLPLACRLPEFQKDPTEVIALLEILKTDPSLMVRRSVANNLNDISKDNPDTVVEVLKNWNKTSTPEMKWLIKHSLRTLLKAGHGGALELLGYPSKVKLSIPSFKLSKRKINMGDSISINLQIKNEEQKSVAVMLDYAVHFMKANGKLAPKVFKGTQKNLQAGESFNWDKAHSFKKIGIRPYYPGKHEIEIRLNGRPMERREFQLVS